MQLAQIRKLITDELGPSLSDARFGIVKFHLSGIEITSDSKDFVYNGGFQQYRGAGWHSFVPTGMSIGFKHLESDMLKLEIKHNLWQLGGFPELPEIAGTMTFIGYERSMLEKEYYDRLSKIHIDSELKTLEFCVIAKQYLVNIFFPWFERHNKIEIINEHINRMSKQDFLVWFGGPFPSQFCRAMKIAMECNNQSKALQIKGECISIIRRAADSDRYSKEQIASYYSSLEEFCNEVGIG